MSFDKDSASRGSTDMCFFADKSVIDCLIFFRPMRVAAFCDKREHLTQMCRSFGANANFRTVKLESDEFEKECER